MRHCRRSNYGLPLWDMVFGTWRNPREGEVACGLAPDREFKVREILMMRDVGGECASREVARSESHKRHLAPLAGAAPGPTEPAWK